MIGIPVEKKDLLNGILKQRSTSTFTYSGGKILVSQSRNYPTATSDYTQETYSYNDQARISTIAASSGSSSSFLWGYKESLPVAKVANCDDLGRTVGSPVQTYSSTTTLSSYVTTPTLISPSFTVSEPSELSMTIVRSPVGSGQPTETPHLAITIVSNSGTTVWGPVTYYDFYTDSETIYLTPGTYNYYYTGQPFLSGGYTGMQFDITHSIPLVQNRVLHTSFEEEGQPYSESRTGSKAWMGTYTFYRPAQAGNYTVTWWQKNGGSPWAFNQVTVTGGAGLTYTIGASGQYVDELRMHPTDAMMTTYTYIPGLGLSTVTDENNRTTYYVYDSFGRLAQIKNDKGGIEKQYTYYYKAN
jgi:YD repeat-containing protein